MNPGLNLGFGVLRCVLWVRTFWILKHRISLWKQQHYSFHEVCLIKQWAYKVVNHMNKKKKYILNYIFEIVEDILAGKPSLKQARAMRPDYPSPKMCSKY
jgi:isoprenylcysteine carboxyl methyltransferase (ICMT) family protein YpbQ